MHMSPSPPRVASPPSVAAAPPAPPEAVRRPSRTACVPAAADDDAPEPVSTAPPPPPLQSTQSALALIQSPDWRAKPPEGGWAQWALASKRRSGQATVAVALLDAANRFLRMNGIMMDAWDDTRRELARLQSKGWPVDDSDDE